MAGVKKALNSATVLERNGVAVPGVLEVAVEGRTSDETDMTDINQTEKEQLLSLRDPGSITGRIAYDPNSPVHKSLEEDSDNRAENTWSVRMEGKIVDGKYTNDAAEVLADVSATVDSGEFVTSAVGKPKIKPGMWLEPSSGEDLVVTAVSGNTISVTQTDGTAASDVAVAQDYKVVSPAVKFSWQGYVMDLSLPGGDYSSGREASFTVRLSGDTTRSYGTPDLT